VTDDEILTFVQASFKSVWTLELLIMLRRNREKAWSRDELVRDLRSSHTVVGEALSSLLAAGLVVDDPGETFRYQAASANLEEIAARIEAMHAAKPMRLIRAITAAPNEKLRIFSDAFKLKDD
jgi:DNA-binding GntR family transcriptional regulator